MKRMTDHNQTDNEPPELPEPNAQPSKKPEKILLPPEIGGQKGPEPTRYGDWEKNGRCTDF
jgi:hypothetical protein